jgi:hypothetical protein
MGYYPVHANFVGFILPEEEDVEVNTKLYSIEVIGEFDGSDSRIHDSRFAFVFKKYSSITNAEFSPGKLDSFPTVEEIVAAKKYCEKRNITWAEPAREILNYIE